MYHISPMPICLYLPCRSSLRRRRVAMGGSEDAELPGDSVLQWPEGTDTEAPDSPTVVTGAQDDSEEDTAANGATAPGHDAPARRRRRRRRRGRGARRRRRTPGGAWADQELAPLKRGERGASDDAHGGESAFSQCRVVGYIGKFTFPTGSESRYTYVIEHEGHHYPARHTAIASTLK